MKAVREILMESAGDHHHLIHANLEKPGAEKGRHGLKAHESTSWNQHLAVLSNVRTALNSLGFFDTSSGTSSGSSMGPSPPNVRSEPLFRDTCQQFSDALLGISSPDGLRSLYLRVMHAAMLAKGHEAGFVGSLQSLAQLPPPFGSWAASTPANEDDWLDPADEVVDPEGLHAWDRLVRGPSGRQAGRRACIQAKTQAGIHADRQAGRQAGGPVGRQAGRPLTAFALDAQYLRSHLVICMLLLPRFRVDTRCSCTRRAFVDY